MDYTITRNLRVTAHIRPPDDVDPEDAADAVLGAAEATGLPGASVAIADGWLTLSCAMDTDGIPLLAGSFGYSWSALATALAAADIPAGVWYVDRITVEDLDDGDVATVTRNTT